MSKHISLPRSRMWRTRAATALAAAGALVMSGGLVMLAAPAATATQGDPEHKVWVCHATTSDSNPYVAIHVDVASTKYEGHLMHRESPNKFWKSAGTWNGIAHDVGSAQEPNKRDYIEGLDFAGNENWEDGALCAAPNDGEDEPVVPQVNVLDNCGTENDSYSVPNAVVDDGDVVQFTYTETPITGGVRLTFTAAKGFYIAEENATFDVLWPNDDPCPRTIDIPATPGQTDPCGAGNASWNVPGDTELLDWSLVNGVLSVSIKVQGVTFTDESTSHSYGTATDSGAPCPQTIQIPAAPTQTDPCGLGNATWDVPADTSTLDWSVTNGVLSVSIIPGGVTFTDGTTSHNYGTATDSGAPCIAGVEEIAPAVSFTDPTCENLDRAKWSGNLTDLVDYAVSGTPGRGNSVTVTANIKPAVADQFAFPAGFDNTFEHSYPSKADLNCPTVKGSESSRPKPHKSPTVLGTQAVAPTAVDAGLASMPSSSATSTASLLAQLMVAGGLLLLLAGGWLGLGRREEGAHEA